MSNEYRPEKLSRRRFGAIAAGGVGAVVAGGFTVFTLADDTPTRRGAGAPIGAFEVHHDDRVYVTMTNGAEFVLEVKERGSGNVLEHHEGVTGESLMTLASEYVTIVSCC